MVALDLSGFGLTAPGRGEVAHNVSLLRRFLDEVVAEPAVLIGNSMGAMVAILAVAADPRGVTGLVLVDPVLPRAKGAPFDRQATLAFAIMAVPRLGEWMMDRRLKRIPAQRRVAALLALLCADPSRVPASVAEAALALEERRAEFPHRSRAFMAASRSLMRLAARAKNYWAAMAKIEVPVLLVQGDRDRLVPVQNARAAAARFPHWRYAELAGVGHVPQLEVPEQTALLISQWMSTALKGHSHA
jgi:pimeloyl-ACP methyl ester carboxylesterase